MTFADVEIARCDVTGHPCGTDTWAEGYSCECASCQAWLKTRQSTFSFDCSICGGDGIAMVDGRAVNCVCKPRPDR